jgi:CYTH domain-containing protein
MEKNELLQILTNQSINMNIERFPGKFILLDVDEIKIEEEVKNISLCAWYSDERIDDNKCVNNFIIEYGNTCIFVNHFYQAKGVWDYLLFKYNINS